MSLKTSGLPARQISPLNYKQIFSTTLVMAATSQAQQMEEHEHKGSDKPEIQTGMPMRGQDMHMMNAKIKSESYSLISAVSDMLEAKQVQKRRYYGTRAKNGQYQVIGGTNST